MSLIAGVAFCPHPPLLVPAVGAGELVAAREPALAAVRTMIAAPIEQVYVIGAGPGTAVFPAGSSGSFAGYGVDVRTRLPGAPAAAAPELPLSLAVAGWLLEAAGWAGPTTGYACDPAGTLPAGLSVDVPTGLLVMGDGSARRTEKAPGWLDARAAGFDAAVAAALAAGDVDALATTDLALAADLLAAGAPAWTAAAGLLTGTTWTADLSYDDAPYGVGYFISTWLVTGR